MAALDEASLLTAADDSFHPPPNDDIWWTETSWYGFDVPERKLSGAIYPLFRPNLGVCSLAVHVWDDTGDTPWDALYSRLLFHVPMPAGDLTKLEVEGLKYTTVEPLRRYQVEFADGEYLELDLEYTGYRAPAVSTTQVPSGIKVVSHFDQTAAVRGQITVAGERIDVDVIGHRDRSWYHRPDNRTRRSASLCFGDLSPDDGFVFFRALTLLGSGPDAGAVGGHLLRDGVSAPIAAASRRVVERVNGRPRRYATRSRWRTCSGARSRPRGGR